MAEAKFGTFEDLLGITEDKLKPVVLRLKEIILEVDPNTVEVVRLGDKAATYGVGPKKMIDGYAYILPHKNWVNLGFYQGAALRDATGILEGTGKKLRHIKMRSLEDTNRPEVKVLVELALEERRRALNN
jgi:hypothetical protein